MTDTVPDDKSHNVAFEGYRAALITYRRSFDYVYMARVLHIGIACARNVCNCAEIKSGKIEIRIQFPAAVYMSPLTTLSDKRDTFLLSRARADNNESKLNAR